MLLDGNISNSYRQIMEQIGQDGMNYIGTFDDSGGGPVMAASSRFGCVGICFGTTTKKLYVYDGSAWLATGALT